MQNGKGAQRDEEGLTNLLKDILITLLGTAGVPQKNIRQIVGCSINRVNNIVKHIKTPKDKP